MTDDYYAWDNRGWALDYLGRYPEAICSYEKAIEINPNYCHSWNNKGIALDKLKRYEEAIVSYNRALELNPSFHVIYYDEACCYGLQGCLEQAIANLQEAIQRDPKYREMAKHDADFDSIREYEVFQSILWGPSQTLPS